MSKKKELKALRCPFTFGALGREPEYYYCVGSNCALWNPDQECCSILTIGLDLAGIDRSLVGKKGETLGEIIQKLIETYKRN